MRHLIFFVIFHAALSTNAIGQEASVSTDAERKLISDRKKEIDLWYEKDLTECQSKFARIDCEKRVRKERRANVESLKRREKEINDAERQQKALKQRMRVEERMKAAPEREMSHADRSRDLKQPPPDDRDAAVQAQIRAQARYDEKIKQAESHRQKVEANNRFKPSKAAGLSTLSGSKSAE
jgi:tRNA U34 5-carboxymethylaminomethyl modifying enzyme MnmG/GidA